jgi:ribosome-binding protein aMBF1 (putative translation factor)
LNLKENLHFQQPKWLSPFHNVSPDRFKRRPLMKADITFGSIVKDRRRRLGLTQAKLARRANCAAITVRKIESDSMRPSVQIAQHLAEALDIPLQERAAFVRLARAEPESLTIPAPPTGA